jgi:RHS repeat-associated protein
LTDASAIYDSFGRMTTVPAQDAGGQPLSLAYYVNDMAQSMSQNGSTVTFSLDPNGRDRVVQGPGSATETDHFADDSDSPIWTQGSGNAFTRNIEGIDGDLVAVQDSSTGISYQLTNLHGDVVATASSSTSATGPATTFETDEFGVPRAAGGIAQKYGYLGSKERPAYLSSGVTQMGERAYVPEMGRFTSVDPILGGSANAYDYANQDPVNETDLDGENAGTKCVAWLAGICIAVTPIHGSPTGNPTHPDDSGDDVTVTTPGRRGDPSGQDGGDGKKGGGKKHQSHNPKPQKKKKDNAVRCHSRCPNPTPTSNVSI